jgi:Flp pilus assembly protein TadB
VARSIALSISPSRQLNNTITKTQQKHNDNRTKTKPQQTRNKTTNKTITRPQQKRNDNKTTTKPQQNQKNYVFDFLLSFCCCFVVLLLRARFVHDPEKICCRFVLVLLSLCCRFVVDLFRARVAGVDHSADGETETACV